jgi:hypothetical protein
VADTIVGAVARGQYFETACALAAIHKDTAYEWLKIGGRRDWEMTGRERIPTQHEALCAEFSDALARANAESEARDIGGVLYAGTQPSVETTKTVVKERNSRGQMVIIKETTATKTSPPDAANLRWHAQHRHAGRWSERHRVEVSTVEPEVVPVELMADKILDRLQELRALRDGEILPSDDGYKALPPGKPSANGSR